ALTDAVKLKFIGLGDIDDFKNIFTKLAGAKSSISEGDREILTWFIKNRFDLEGDLSFPESIPFKEQLCFLAALAYKWELTDQFSKCVKTATDVLRIACGMSDGDISLATPTKFKN